MIKCEECGARFKEKIKYCEACGTEFKNKYQDCWDKDFKPLNIPPQYQPYKDVTRTIGLFKKRKSVSRRIRT